MSETNSSHARTHLHALLRRVQAGERFLITRHGRPVASLVPARAAEPTPGAGAVEALRRFGNSRMLGPDLSVRDLIDGGRRG